MTSETEAEVRGVERTVEVSPRVLALICPENRGLNSVAPSPSRLHRLGTGLRVRWRLLWARIRFRFDDFQTARCFAAGFRLKLRLLWMRIRHHNRLSP